jgi:nicotinamide-nucleotide amidase
MATDSVVHQLAIRVSNKLRDERLMLATAESCTGGMVATAITDISGSSGWFERGFVTYSNQAKAWRSQRTGGACDGRRRAAQ